MTSAAADLVAYAAEDWIVAVVRGVLAATVLSLVFYGLGVLSTRKGLR